MQGTGHHVTFVTPLTKFVPLTVSEIWLEVPATVLVGEMDVTPPELIVNVWVVEVTPLTGSVTLKVAVPAVATRLLGTAAVIEVEVGAGLTATTRVVGVLPEVQVTVGFAGKLVPVSTMLKPVAPAFAELGFNPVTAGRGLMVKFCVVLELVTPT